MPVTGGKRLHFVADLDNRPLKRGATQAKGIVGGMKQQFRALAPFSPLSAGAIGVGVAVGAMFAKITKDAFEFSNNFSIAMREVQTISQAAQDDFEALGESIINISAREATDDAVALAEAYYQIASAGFDGAEGLNILSVSSKAAIAGVTETKIAADGLTTVLNAWGKSASEAEDVADVLFKTVERGKTTFPELAQGMSIVASQAAAMGIPLEQISAAVATLTKQGNTTSVAFTQIRAAILALNDNLGDGWSEVMTFQEALQELRDMSGDSETKLRELTGRVEGMNAVLATTGTKAKEAAEDLTVMQEAAESMQTAYDTMMKEADNKWSLVHNKWQRELKGLGDAIKLGSIDIADALNRLLTDREIDIIEPEINSRVNEVATSLDKLGTREEKLTALSEAIIVLREEMVKLNTESGRLQGVQPSLLQSAFEGFKITTLGAFGADQMELAPGAVNKDLLSLAEEKIAINREIEARLFKLYQETLKNLAVPPPPPPGEAAKLKTVQDALDAIEELEGKLATAPVEKQIEIYAKIANEQEFLDDVQKKLREAMAAKVGINIDIDKDKLKEQLKELEAELNNLRDVQFESAPGEREDNLTRRIELINLIGEKKNEIESGTGRIKRIEADITTVIKGQLQPMKTLTKEEKERLKINNDIEDSKREQTDLEMEQAESLEIFLSDLSQAEQGLRGIAGEFRGVNDEIAVATEAIADFVNIIGNISAGNYGGAIAGLAGLFIDAFVPMDDVIGKFEYFIQLSNDLISSWTTAGTALEGFGVDAFEKQLVALEAGLIGVAAGVNKINIPDWGFDATKVFINNMETMGFTIDGLDEKIKELSLTLISAGSTLSDTQREEIQGLIDTYNQFRDYYESLILDLTGTSADTLTGALIDAFSEGEDAALRWGDTVNDVIKDIVLNQFSAKLLSQPIEEALDDFLQSTQTEGVSGDNLNELRNNLNEIFVNAQPLFEGLTESLRQMGIDLTGDAALDSQGLTGGFRGASEETMSFLAGQFTAMREDLKIVGDGFLGQQDFFDDFLEVQEQIRDNTNSLSRLENIEKQMTEMNSKMQTSL